MPPKRKKQNEEKPFVDVMSCLDEVGQCLERAESSSKACLEGIAKADLALRESQGDSDIQCVVLVKRTELLLIAANNNYNLDGLPGSKNQYSLESCIADCERVLNDVSAEDIAGKHIRETAKAVCIKAQKLIKDMEYEEKKRGGKSANNRNMQILQASPESVFKRYDPSKTCFKTMDKINTFLLQDIVDCYKQARNICRTCYFRRHVQEQVVAGRHCRGCKKIPQSLIIIPASKMCENLSGAKVVAVPPPPKMMMQPSNRHKPFQMCKNYDHQLCEDKATVGENWFAHSIEELVIWTVQRHYGCKFQKYIDQYHEESAPPDLTLFSSPPPVPHAPQGEPSEDGVDTDDLFSDSYSDNGNTDERFDYYPGDQVFPDVASIPRNLLLSVIDKYKSVKEYCKVCYYTSTKQGVASRDRHTNKMVCSICRLSWKSVLVIPASELCWNFGDLEFLPIAPWPVTKPNRDPFEYCKKKDHFRCFKVYYDHDFWYPHSVEEMVIWTVERENQCTFTNFISDQSSIQPKAPASGRPPPSNYNPAIPQHTQLEGAPLRPQAGGMMMPRPPSPMGRPVSRPPPPPPANASMGGRMPMGPDGRMNTPANNMPMGKNGPFLPGPPPRYISAANMRPFGNGGNGNPSPMMYLSQPSPMYSNGRILIPRVPIGPMLSQQPIPYPGRPGPPNQPPHPRMIAMPPHNFNPYIAVNHFPAYPKGPTPLLPPPPPSHGPPPGPPPGIGPDVGTSKAAGLQEGKVQETGSENISLQRTGSNSRVSPIPVSSSVDNPPTKNTNSKTIDSSSGGAVSGGVAYSSSPAKISAGRKNYRVVQSPSRGGGGGGVSSISGEQDVEVKAVSVAPILATRVEESMPPVFKFSEIDFKSFLDIPERLLRSIVLCFREKMIVCRKCFYGERHLSRKQEEAGQEVCSMGEHKWIRPVVVIPGCEMCNNEPSFQKGEHIPLPPLPPVAVLQKCPSRNHHKCFTKSLEKDLRQAHSVEELVVWIVESEKDCSFEDYIKEAKLDTPEGVVSLSPSKATATPLSDRVEPSKGASSGLDGDNTTQGQTTQGQGSTSTPSKPTTKNLPSSETTPKKPPNNTNYISPRMKPKNVKKYHPKDVSFVIIDDIPPDLLTSVAVCFKDMRIVCRICFFESNCTLLIKKKEKTCEKDHVPWKPIKVIPRSPLCLTLSEYIPLPPLPKHMRQSNIPFVVCKKTDHRTCYAMSKGTNPWFPHTVEELVVWTVERECGEVFENVYEDYLPQEQATQESQSSHPPGNRAPTKPGSDAPKKTKTSSAANKSTNLPTAAPNPAVSNGDTRTLAPSDVATPFEAEQDVQHPPREPVSLSEAVSATEFPLGSYRKPQDLMSGGYPHMQFDDSFPSDMLLKETPTNEVIRTNSMGLGLSGIAPAFENSFGLSSGMDSTPGIFSPFPSERDSKQGQSESSNGNWREASLDGFGKVESENEKSWSRVVGMRQGVEPPVSRDTPSYEHRPELKFTGVSLHDTSFGYDEDEDDIDKQFPKRPSDDFIHQSQVENDTFQPYAAVRDTPLLPGIFTRATGDRGGGIAKAREIAAVHGKGWTKEEEVEASRGRKARKKTREAEAKNRNTSQGNGRRKEPSDGNNNNNSLSSSGLSSWSSPGQADRNAKAKDAFLSCGETENTADRGGYGLEMQMNGDMLTTWGASNELSIMASAFAAAATNDKLEVREGNENTLQGYQAIGDLSRPGSGSLDALVQKDVDVFADYSPTVDNRSNGSVRGGKFSCLLCYVSFETAEELGSHCATNTHMEIAMLDSGAEKVWQYAPPPPRRIKESRLQVCSMPMCDGAPYCQLPHSQEELVEWQARTEHRDQRRNKDGLYPATRASAAAPGTTIPVAASQVLQASISDVSKIANNCYSWDITLQGKNWLNLFGVTIKPSSSWVFKITCIKEVVTQDMSLHRPMVFHPHSPSWLAPPFNRNHQLRQCLLLGCVEVTIKAIPPSNKRLSPISAQVLLDLGYKQCFSIDLEADTHGNKIVRAGSKNQVDKFGPAQEEPTFAPKEQSTLPLDQPPLGSHEPTFVPQHRWQLLSQSSSSSDDLGDLNIEGEDLTLQHVPIEDWGCSLTDDQSQDISGTATH